ncbi:Double Zinc Ribbon And Ankyrin Repeat-Containing Protein 1 [Manis pentadactyla]|nr:Double Zinc Ribbon And Ankyrin Repeat-Containing Protein 1 [Manis pentadactyla]
MCPGPKVSEGLLSYCNLCFTWGLFPELFMGMCDKVMRSPSCFGVCVHAIRYEVSELIWGICPVGHVTGNEVYYLLKYVYPRYEISELIVGVCLRDEASDLFAVGQY